MDDLTEAEGTKGNDTNHDENEYSCVYIDVEERIRVGGVFANQVFKPEPVGHGEKGDNDIAIEDGYVPIVHVEEVVHRGESQRHKMDFDIQEEGQVFFLGYDQGWEDELQGPVDQ